MSCRSRRTPGTARIADVELNKPRIWAALSAALALAPVPGGSRFSQYAAPVPQITGQGKLHNPAGRL
jgi:hypothetical protein